MSYVQIFSKISDQNALFFMERGELGQNIFVVFLLVDSLGLERTRKWFVIDIMYRKMRKRNLGVKMIALANRLAYHLGIA